MLIAADYPFLDVFWTIIIFFFWVIWIWIVIQVLIDIFRRDDIGGFTKALWVIFVDQHTDPGQNDLSDRRGRRDARAQDELGPGTEIRLHVSRRAWRAVSVR